MRSLFRNTFPSQGGTLSRNSTVAIVSSIASEHSRDFCESAAEYLRNNCGWSVQLILRDDVESVATLQRYDGIILRDAHSREYNMVEECGKPVVEAAVKGFGKSDFASVDCDERALGYLAARHFLEHGFRNFGFLGYRGASFSDMREKYYTEALGMRGFRPFCFPERGAKFTGILHEDRDLDEVNFAKWVRGLPPGTGVFCANDVMSHKLLAVCNANGIAVPEDIAILGADDDILLCNVNNPTLSSISLNARGIGIAAAKIMSKILTGRAGDNIGMLHIDVQPGRLSARDSTAIYRFGPNWLSKALVFIDREAVRISASDVYRKVRRSHTAVDAAFSAHVGTTVQKRIMSVRLEEAKRLLVEERVPVAEIADVLGFPSAQYFGNTFKLFFNITPAAYRRQYGN